MSTIIRVLLMGDLFGKTGRSIFARHIRALQEKYSIDISIVNGENCADGKGITPEIAKFLQSYGVQVITTGNHVWDKKEIIPYMSEHDTVLRPANYPDKCPGTGMTFIQSKGFTVGIMNIMGRLFMPVQLDCPFAKVDKLLKESQTITPIMIVDFHAEVTAEKQAMGNYLDGRVSVVVGTHTHVQTADATVLPKGTAYLTDLGMGGSLNSMIGAKKEALLYKMTMQMPVRHEVSNEAPYVLSGAVVTINATTGKSLSIETVYIVDNEPL